MEQPGTSVPDEFSILVEWQGRARGSLDAADLNELISIVGGDPSALLRALVVLARSSGDYS